MALINSLPTRMVPWLGWSRPAISLSSVVFPEPLGPIRARNSPSGTSRLRSFSTSICSLPRRKYLCRLLTRTIGSADMHAPSVGAASQAGPGRGPPSPPIAMGGLLRRHLLAFLLLERHDHAHVRLEVDALFLLGHWHLDAHRDG